MNRSTVLISLVALVFLTVGGCLMNPVREPSSPDSAFVYGRIDLSGAKDQLNWVSMLTHPRDPNKKKRLNYGGITDVMVHVHSDGTFFAENVDPGQYYLLYVDGKVNGFTRTKNIYYLQDMSTGKVENPDVFTVHAGEFVYLGAWGYKSEKKGGGFFGTKDTEFSFNPLEDVSEADVLQTILPLVKGTAWQEKIQRRLGK